MWCWRRVEKISWTNHVRNEEVLLRVNEHRNMLHEIRKWKANWIGHILCRNCLLQQVIEGKIKGQIEVTIRWRRRRKKVLDDLKDRRGYCQLKEEALDRTVWRNRFGRGFGPVIWQITDDDDTILAMSVPPVRSVYTATSDMKGVAFPLTRALYAGYLAKTGEWNMSSEHRWNNNDKKTKAPWAKLVPVPVYHKSHTTQHGIRPGPSQWQAYF